ncbi:MAG TPA: VWA domain-containing protein [Terriglobales bacterium]|nr:VWA domain-containing protein [Terriglobales bacterium]
MHSTGSGSLRVSALIMLLLAAAVPVAAQQFAGAPAITARLATPATQGLLTVSARVDEVNLLFTVTDRKGHFVTDLAESDFQVLDDHKPPDSIRLFQQQSDLPLRVGLLIDLSTSITDRFDFEKKAAATFLKKTVRAQTDQAFVLGFNQKLHLVQDATGNPKELTSAVQKLKAGGSTSLYDAIVYACRKLQSGPHDQLVRKVLIVITDGADTTSRSSLGDAEQAAAKAETAIFALSTNELHDGEYPKGEAVLDLLTRYAGGQILRAREAHQLAKAFAQVENALRSQYVIAYKPADFRPDGNFRPIELKPVREKLHIQCRRGYFAPRENPD